MVPAYNGTKLVVFGGTPTTGIADHISLGDIYTLDLVTMAWTAGSISENVRARMACSVAGDNFIALGGKASILFCVTLVIIFLCETGL